MQINVAVIFGCCSVEHEVSIISAVQAMHSIDREKYNGIPDGMVPMCYPADAMFGDFIPQWSLWLLLELENYYKI